MGHIRPTIKLYIRSNAFIPSLTHNELKRLQTVFWRDLKRPIPPFLACFGRWSSQTTKTHMSVYVFYHLRYVWLTKRIRFNIFIYEHPPWTVPNFSNTIYLPSRIRQTYKQLNLSYNKKHDIKHFLRPWQSSFIFSFLVNMAFTPFPYRNALMKCSKLFKHSLSAFSDPTAILAT